MHDAALVGVGDGIADVSQELEPAFAAQAFVRAVREQTPPTHQLHREVGQWPDFRFDHA